MFRFLSKRFRRRDGARPLGNHESGQQNQKNSIHCKILLLDGTDLTLYMRKKSTGEDLFSRVCDNIGLYVESDYFGLQYTDTNSQSHWLDNTKEIRKQVKIGPPYSFRLKVKFYCCDPNTLRDEFSRYLFFLQVSIYYYLYTLNYCLLLFTFSVIFDPVLCRHVLEYMNFEYIYLFIFCIRPLYLYLSFPLLIYFFREYKNKITPNSCHHGLCSPSIYI